MKQSGVGTKVHIYVEFLRLLRDARNDETHPLVPNYPAVGGE